MQAHVLETCHSCSAKVLPVSSCSEHAATTRPEGNWYFSTRGKLHPAMRDIDTLFTTSRVKRCFLRALNACICLGYVAVLGHGCTRRSRRTFHLNRVCDSEAAHGGLRSQGAPGGVAGTEAGAGAVAPSLQPPPGAAPRPSGTAAGPPGWRCTGAADGALRPGRGPSSEGSGVPGRARGRRGRREGSSGVRALPLAAGGPRLPAPAAGSSLSRWECEESSLSPSLRAPHSSWGFPPALHTSASSPSGLLEARPAGPTGRLAQCWSFLHSLCVNYLWCFHPVLPSQRGTMWVGVVREETGCCVGWC